MLARMNADASKEMAVKADSPGVVAPPLAIYLATMAAGLGAHALCPLPLGLGGWGLALGGYLIFLGSALTRLAMTWFRRAGTTVNPYGSSSTVVCDGPFAISRNPIYVGMTAITVGAAGVLDDVWVLAMLTVVLPVMHWGVIRREEAYLERKFGAEYRAYRARVRRWL